MIVRFGYVAMSVHVKNASTSQTMTVAQFSKIPDREAAIRKLERIAESNLHNTLRLLYHNKAHDIHFYRFSSRLVPLIHHEEYTKDWDYITPIKDKLGELGEYVKAENMRVGFHPDHYTLLNSPRKAVLHNSIIVLQYHYDLLKNMGINPTHRCVIHVGGSYTHKNKAIERFKDQFPTIPEHLQKMIILENDDKVFTASDVLSICESLNIPMVFDIHHHRCNHDGEGLEELCPRIVKTWSESPLPIKMHVSSAKSEKVFRSHADSIKTEDIVPFLFIAKHYTDQLDVMIEAKWKDEALFRLMKNVKSVNGIRVIDEGTIEI